MRSWLFSLYTYMWIIGACVLLIRVNTLAASIEIPLVNVLLNSFSRQVTQIMQVPT